MLVLARGDVPVAAAETTMVFSERPNPIGSDFRFQIQSTEITGAFHRSAEGGGQVVGMQASRLPC